MNEVNKKSNIFDYAIGIIIGVPIALVLIALALPWILYYVVIKAPIENSKKKKFFSRNEGKVLLCVTPSSKYKVFKSKSLGELQNMGIHDIVVFDCEKSNNTYEEFNWDNMIGRSKSFPLLLKLQSGIIKQTPLKSEFQAFFKNEIDSIQLLGSIKWKMTHNKND